MDPKWLPNTPQGKLWRLVEECNETIHEACKLGRFGGAGRRRDGRSAKESLAGELDDLIHAIGEVKACLVAGQYDEHHEDFGRLAEKSS